MTFCMHCGAKMDAGVTFCGNCGKEISGSANDEQNPYAPPQQSATGFEAGKKNPWQYFIDVFRKYAVFKGRARRAEFWWFTLFNSLISIVLSVAETIFDLHIFEDVGILSIVWSLAVLVPSFSVTARRMHDCDKSAWYMLIPIYGTILCFIKGTYGPNRFGPDPIERSDT